MHYPLGWPGAKLFNRLFGWPISIRLYIVHDPEARVYVATSPDAPGLVIEADTLDELMQEAKILLPDFLDNLPEGPLPLEVTLPGFKPC